MGTPGYRWRLCGDAEQWPRLRPLLTMPLRDLAVNQREGHQCSNDFSAVRQDAASTPFTWA